MLGIFHDEHIHSYVKYFTALLLLPLCWPGCVTVARDWLVCQVIAVWLMREYPIRGEGTRLWSLSLSLSRPAHCMPPDQQSCQSAGRLAEVLCL